MRIRFAAAWCTATLAGLGVSWWGVQFAVGGTALGDAPVAAVPVRTGPPPTPSGTPVPAPAQRETLSPSPEPTATSPTAAPTAERSAPDAGKPSSDVRTIAVKSGQVVLEVREHGARLVSASPEQGFEVKEWRRDGWMRVDLTDGEHGSAVIATWHDHPTMVQVYEY